MDCKTFSKYIGDYVNRTLDIELGAEAEDHLNGCAECASLVSELQATSLMVQSLDKAGAPAGFEDRLKARLSAVQPVPVRKTLKSRLSTAVRMLAGGNAQPRRTVFWPALAGLILFAVIAGSFLIVGHDQVGGGSDMDWAYIETCQEQHASFASANPLADDSAVILRERVRERTDL